MRRSVPCLPALLLAAGTLVLAGCGSSDSDRAISGGAIGAGAGAAMGAATGGSALGGAILGGAVGAAAGVLTDDDQIDLGDAPWRD
jgi:hypothetical protein